MLFADSVKGIVTSELVYKYRVALVKVKEEYELN